MDHLDKSLTEELSLEDLIPEQVLQEMNTFEKMACRRLFAGIRSISINNESSYPEFSLNEIKNIYEIGIYRHEINRERNLLIFKRALRIINESKSDLLIQNIRSNKISCLEFSFFLLAFAKLNPEIMREIDINPDSILMIKHRSATDSKTIQFSIVYETVHDKTLFFMPSGSRRILGNTSEINRAEMFIRFMIKRKLKNLKYKGLEVNFEV